jgi:DNA-binding transcriptional ArsR family regulator
MPDPRKADLPLPRFRLASEAHRTLPVLQDGGTDCVVALRALSEDTRLRIVGVLLESPLGVGEIADRLGVSQYNVSKHLRVLREAGLLSLEKDGRVHRYALPDDIRRQVTAGSVLDLGCCSFQFESAQRSSRPRSRRRRVASA